LGKIWKGITIGFPSIKSSTDNVELSGSGSIPDIPTNFTKGEEMKKFGKKSNDLNIRTKRGCWLNEKTGVLSYGYGSTNDRLVEGEEREKLEKEKFGK
jgi:hypothetical protein